MYDTFWATMAISTSCAEQREMDEGHADNVVDTVGLGGFEFGVRRLDKQDGMIARSGGPEAEDIVVASSTNESVHSGWDVRTS